MEKDFCLSVKEAERKCYRIQCYIRCLESNLDRISIEEFEPLMAKLEAAHIELEMAIIQEAKIRISNPCVMP